MDDMMPTSDEDWKVQQAADTLREVAKIYKDETLLKKAKKLLQEQKESIEYALDDIKECMEDDDDSEPKEKLDKFMSRMNIKR